MSVTDVSFTTTELTPLIGTRVETDRDILLSGKHAGKIRELLEQRGVLVFPKVHFDDDDQIAFTQTLGTIADEYAGSKVEDGKTQKIFKVSLDEKVAPTAKGLRSSFFWHLDGSLSEVPILASILSAKKLSDTGGDTEFCNTYAAYEALSDEDKVMLEGMKAIHSAWSIQRHSDPEPSYADLKQAMNVPARAQPIVWKHRSGRKSLVIGTTAAYIEGMDFMASIDLLTRLRDFATQPQFVYRHQWTIGDLVMWDNTGTLHRAMPYPWDSGRLMHRTALAGEEAFA
jgi:alpha-ketoglutarate-dependent taurine dioxygenase